MRIELSEILMASWGAGWNSCGSTPGGSRLSTGRRLPATLRVMSASQVSAARMCGPEGALTVGEQEASSSATDRIAQAVNLRPAAMDVLRLRIADLCMERSPNPGRPTEEL